MTKCDSCGNELHIGDWPYCPHGSSRFHVDAFEGYFDEMIDSDPVWITSAHQRRKIMDEKGLEYKEKFRNDRAGALPLFFDMGRR